MREAFERTVTFDVLNMWLDISVKVKRNLRRLYKNEGAAIVINDIIMCE